MSYESENNFHLQFCKMHNELKCILPFLRQPTTMKKATLLNLLVSLSTRGVVKPEAPFSSDLYIMDTNKT